MKRAALAAFALAAACSRPTPRPATRACPTTPVRVHAQDELEALRTCTTLRGLEIRGAVPLDLEPLATLTAIEGDLHVRATFALGSIRLPALAHVTGDITLASNMALTGIYLPALASARSVSITDSPQLMEISLSALAQVEGSLTLGRLPSLELVDLTALPTAFPVVLDGPHRITTWLGGPPEPGSQP
jgi:hypothetical protein